MPMSSLTVSSSIESFEVIDYCFAVTAYLLSFITAHKVISGSQVPIHSQCKLNALSSSRSSVSECPTHSVVPSIGSSPFISSHLPLPPSTC